MDRTVIHLNVSDPCRMHPHAVRLVFFSGVRIHIACLSILIRIIMCNDRLKIFRAPAFCKCRFIFCRIFCPFCIRRNRLILNYSSCFVGMIRIVLIYIFSDTAFSDRIPWWAWILMIPGFMLAPLFWFIYDLINPSKLKRDREAYWKNRGDGSTPPTA